MRKAKGMKFIALFAVISTVLFSESVQSSGIPIVAKDILSVGNTVELKELNQVVYEKDCAGRTQEFKTRSSSRIDEVVLQVNKLKRVNGEKVRRIRLINRTSGSVKVFKNKALGKNRLDLRLNDPSGGFSLVEGPNEIEVQLLGKNVKDPVTRVKSRMVIHSEIQVIQVNKTIHDLPATTQNTCSYFGYYYWRYPRYHYYWHSHAWYSWRYNRRWDWVDPYSPYHWRIGYQPRTGIHWYPGWRNYHIPRRSGSVRVTNPYGGPVVIRRSGGVSNTGVGRTSSGQRGVTPRPLPGVPRVRNTGRGVDRNGQRGSTAPVYKRVRPRITPPPSGNRRPTRVSNAGTNPQPTQGRRRRSN